MDSSSLPTEYLGEDVPRNVQMMALLLKSMGIEEWEPRVVNQLLEFMYSYTSDVLKDSAEYAAHAGRPQQLDISDVRLAVESKTSKCQTPPDRAVRAPTVCFGWPSGTAQTGHEKEQLEHSSTSTTCSWRHLTSWRVLFVEGKLPSHGCPVPRKSQHDTVNNHVRLHH